MLYITDFRTDDSDDIIIENGDIAIEEDGYSSAIKTGERRCSARYDDFSLDDINAGIERYIYQHTDMARTGIIFELRRVLKANLLFIDSDFDVVIPDIKKKDMQVFIKINSNLTDSNGFRVIVDQLNQNSYR